MLIFCCGMMRSGSTVQYQIVTELIESRNLGISIGWISQFNATAAKILEDAARRDDKMIVLKTHHYTAEAASLHERGLAKMIYSYRDLRDVVVSLGHQFYDSPEEVLSGSTVSRLLRNDYRWRHLPDILVSRYESIVDELPKEVLRIAHHLNISLTAQQAASIADKFSLARQRQRIGQLQLPSAPEAANIYDPVNQLHPGHIQSATVGQWQSVLSSSQVTALESAILSWLVDRGYLVEATQPDRVEEVANVELEGEQLCRRGQWQKASEIYQRAIRLGVCAPKIHHALGRVYFHQGKFLAAVNAYQHASALAPNIMTYACDLGGGWARAGEYKLAASVYRQAIAKQPQAQLPRSGLAKVLSAQGKLKKSAEILKLPTDKRNDFEARSFL